EQRFGSSFSVTELSITTFKGDKEILLSRFRRVKLSWNSITRPRISSPHESRCILPIPQISSPNHTATVISVLPPSPFPLILISYPPLPLSPFPWSSGPTSRL